MSESAELRILAIGDCNTGGLGAFSVPSVLAQNLVSRGVNCRVQNLGEAMYCSREGRRKAQSVSAPTDVLLLNFGLVDAWVTAIPWAYISYFPDSRLKKFCRKLLKSLKKRLRSPLARKCLSEGPVVEPDEFENNVRAIVAHARIHNPNLQVLIWGTAPSNDPDRNQRLLAYDKILQNIARETGSYLDTRTLLQPYDRNLIFQDPVHLSKLGCELVAHEMAKLLRDKPDN